MATANISAALRAPSHPMAIVGYGKRHAPDEAPRGAADFAHLPAGEAAPPLTSTGSPKAPQPEKSAHQEEIVGAEMMCAFCDEDESTTTLVDGVCVDCRADIDRDEAAGATGDVPDTFLARPRQQMDVAARVVELRAASGRGTLPPPRRR
ncbi:hypothetical protein ACFT7S_03880 [Streptomyces sp. NPDC057136]|uniref:hypothetical protein n=1 Tax=Streptomyces sp. NPDC057136 TaxID=3346029 RepID=UPI003633C7BB